MPANKITNVISADDRLAKVSGELLRALIIETANAIDPDVNSVMLIHKYTGIEYTKDRKAYRRTLLRYVGVNIDEGAGKLFDILHALHLELVQSLAMSQPFPYCDAGEVEYYLLSLQAAVSGVITRMEALGIGKHDRH